MSEVVSRFVTSERAQRAGRGRAAGAGIDARGTKGRHCPPPARRATEPAGALGELGRWPGAQAGSNHARCAHTILSDTWATRNSGHASPNRGTSLMRNAFPPSGHHIALDIVLLWGLRKGLFRMSEVPR